MSGKKVWRPSIEYNLTEHCNLSCTHCDHASSILPKKLADLDVFRRDLEVLSTALEVAELKLGGGEVLLHPQLIDFLKVARSIEIARRVVLLTNGVLLHKAPTELWELIDGMWISLYPGVRQRFDWDWIQEMAEKHKVWVWRKETPEFSKRTLVKEIESKEMVQLIFDNCALAHFESCHTVHEGRYYICSPAAWAEPRLALHGVDFKNRAADGIPIHDNPALREDLEQSIRGNRPLKACRFCLGSFARSTPNAQLNPSDQAAFLARAPEALTDLVDSDIIIPQSYVK